MEEILQHRSRREEENIPLSKQELEDELAKIMAEDSSDESKHQLPIIQEDDQSSGNETWESNEEEAEEEAEEANAIKEVKEDSDDDTDSQGKEE